jgi:DNA-binding CsgD family transcriptional regulator
MVVLGEPGIGKTALLEQAVGSAGGFVVLRARPLEAESDLAFAGLADVVRPILHLRERIPAPQAAALGGALALGPPAPGDRFAVGAATLSLLAAAAEESPVLVIVDDAHWLDTPSRQALIFAGRRLGSEGVLLLLGMRERDWIRDAGIDTLELHGLSRKDATDLVDSAAAGVDPAVCERLVAETRGNPLAILEAIATLNEGELRGTVPIAHPLAVGASLEQAFAQQLDGLPQDTRRALLIAAASDTESAVEIGRALSEAGVRTDALEPAERARVVAFADERIEFRHPLLRSVAYHLSDPVERRAAHRALAAALGGDSAERAAWQLAAATAGPDEEVAALLEKSGMAAFARSAYATAARALETAAHLSPGDGDRLRRTIGAGRALWLAGELQRALTLLEGVLDLAVEPTVRAELQELRGAAMLFTRPVSETFATLVAEADRTEPHDQTRAAALLSTALLTRMMAGDLARAKETAERAVRAAGSNGQTISIVAKSLLGVARAQTGELDEGRALLEPMFESLQSIDPLGEVSTALSATAQTLVWIEQWDRAKTMFDRMVRAARRAGAPGLLNFPLAMLAEFELRRGRLAAAYAAATESVQLAAETGQASLSSFSLVTLGRVEAVLGHDEDCRRHVATGLEFARRTGAGSIESYATAALGLLELSRGNPENAAVQLAESARLEEQAGQALPTVVESSADLVEAYIRSGALTEAERSLAVLEGQARETALRWPRGRAARCRGMLADEEHYEQEFDTALELHGEEMAFERARTQLALGMRRRRSRRRADARAALHQALAYFERAGADPWAEQARVELRASGESAPARDTSSSLRSLTPQELQVALVVARGLTNREAAAELFLSPKTVEFHLGNAYRKLRVRSRAELVRRVEGLP